MEYTSSGECCWTGRKLEGDITVLVAYSSGDAEEDEDPQGSR
jgi:hypothetical protein